MLLSEYNNETYKILFNQDPNILGTQNQDYEEALQYAEEFYRVHLPDVEYVEINRDASSPSGALTDLWNEQVGGLQVNRRLTIKVFPDYATEEQQKHTKQGVELSQDIRFAYSFYHLRKFNLFPEIGDHIIYKQLDYEIMKVYIRPEDLWEQSNAPLYVSCFSSIYRPGDRQATVQPDRL